MFVTNAHAQDAGGVASSTSFVTFIPLVLVFAIMYFFIIRPHRAQMKRRQEMLSAVRRGDTVITGGGIVGKVIKVNGESDELEIEVGEGVRIRVIRSTLADVRVKGVPLSEEQSKPDAKMKISQKPKAKAATKGSSAAPKKEKAMLKKDKSEA